MHPLFDTPRPNGFHTLNAYLFTEAPERLIQFAQDVFYAQELSRTTDPDSGIIRNCILQIGDSCFMIAQASDAFTGMRSAFYLYVNDVDGTYQRALEHGASSVFEAADMEFGDRQAGIVDPAGNYWWISQRLLASDYSSSY